MSKNSNKKLKWITIAVLIMVCACLGLVAGCKTVHTHEYEWKYNETEHWKECPIDGAEEEGSRGEHLYVAGECECGKKEPVVEKKYGTVTGTVKLHKLGGYDTDYTGVMVDMGDEVQPELNRETGVITVENVEVGKNYTLTVSKTGYQPYTVTVKVPKENDTVTIGGNRGIVLEYKVFGVWLGWDADLHDFSHVNDAKPYIGFKENGGGKTFNVISNDKYGDVSSTIGINYNNSTHTQHSHGMAIKFEDGKHIVLRFHYNQDDNCGIQFVASLWGGMSPNALAATNALLDNGEFFNTYGEKWIHMFSAAELAKIKGEESVPLTAVLKDGKMYVIYDGACIYTTQLPEGYGDKKSQIIYWSFDGASNAIFDYEITENLPVLESTFDIDVTKPEGIDCTVTAEPQKEKYELGEEVELTFNAAEGYKLSALTVNGVDMYNSVVKGKLTVKADRASVTVNATFVQEEPIALNLAVKGNKMGTAANLAEGTEVTLSGIETPFTVDANGKISGNVAKGRYTVSVAGYISKEIVVSEELTEIVLDYDLFKVVIWDRAGHDFSHVNDADPYIKWLGNGSTLNAISKEKLYDNVVVSTTIKGANTTDGEGRQGIFLQFEDGKAAILCINTSSPLRLQYCTNFFFREGGLTSVFNPAEGEKWVEFKNVTAEEVQKYNSDTGIELKIYRSGKYLYTYIDSTFKGVAELPDGYEDDKVAFGIFSYGAKKDCEYHFKASDKAADFPKINVTVTDNTAANAGGELTISQNVKLGDTVTITVTPDSTHVLDAISVSGGITPELQGDGVYTFVPMQTEYTVTATFKDKPKIEAETTVSGIGLGNTSVNFEDGTVVTFTSETGTSVALKVAEGKVKGTLLPGVYTVTVAGYYPVTATVDDNGAFEGLTDDGLKFEKVIFTTNGINEPTNNIFGAGNEVVWSADNTHVASTGKFVSTQVGKMYEWTGADESEQFADVALTVTLKSGNGNQGIIMRFDNNNTKDVRLRFENSKAQWMSGGWWWGSFPIIDDWSRAGDFGSGENYANPMSAALLEKYNGNGLTLTLLRKGGMVYAIIDGQVYSALNLADGCANKKVRVCFFAENSAAGYEIPFTLSTDVNSILSKATNENGVMGVVGKWTTTENTLAVDGKGYAEFAPASDTTKESLAVTLKDGNSNAGKKAQGVIYNFADGRWIAARMETTDTETYIQYADDMLISKTGGSLTGWAKVKDFDKSVLSNGISLKMVRDGRYIYVLLGNEVIDVKTLDEKYATMDGVFAATMDGGTGTAFAYEYKSGDDVIPEGYYTASATIEGDAHGYEVSLDKSLVKNGENLTVTIVTSNANSAWSFFPTAISVNGTAIDFTKATKESLGANRCKFTYTLENVTSYTEVVVTIGGGTRVNYDVTVNNAEYGSVVCDMTNQDPANYYHNLYFWNDLCTWTITAKEGYELEKIVIGEGENAVEITEGWTVNGNVYTYKYTVTGDIKAVMYFKAAQTVVVTPVIDDAKTIIAEQGLDTRNFDDASANFVYYEIYGGNETVTKAGKNDLVTSETVTLGTKATDFPAGMTGGSAQDSKNCYTIAADGSIEFTVKVIKGLTQIQVYVSSPEDGAEFTATVNVGTESKTLTKTTNAAEGAKNVKIVLDTTSFADDETRTMTIKIQCNKAFKCASIGIRATGADINNAN